MNFSLKKNELIDIIFPSTSCNKAEISLIESYVRNKLSLQPIIWLDNEMVDNNQKLPSYSIKSRFYHLEKALNNNKSKAIWCGKGGFGSGDLLPLLAKSKINPQNKTIIGFSDSTSILTFLQHNLNYQPIYGSDLFQLSQGKINSEAESELIDLIFSRKTKLEFKVTELTNSNKEIYAQITGGCLSVFVSQIGGLCKIDLTEKILFLEDEGEFGERIDRYLRQILEFIIANNQKPAAILLGNFAHANEYSTPKQDGVNKAIETLLKKIKTYELDIPIFKTENHDIGHGPNMRPLPFGKKAKLNSDELLIAIAT